MFIFNLQCRQGLSPALTWTIALYREGTESRKSWNEARARHIEEGFTFAETQVSGERCEIMELQSQDSVLEHTVKQ